MLKENIKKELQRIEEDSLYSAKGHFYAAQLWELFNLSVGIPLAVLSAVAGASAFSDFPYHGTVAGVIALLVSIITAISTTINPSKKAALHHTSGNQYNSLKNDARIACSIELENITDDEKATKILKEYNSRRNELNKTCPQIPKWAFNKAKNGIMNGEADYKADQPNK